MAHRAASDPVAFKPVLALLAPRIRAFFLQSFPDAVLADALTETTLLRLRHERVVVDTREQPLKAWIFGIAAGVRREELRRRYDLPSHVGESELAQAESRAVAPAAPEPQAAQPSPADAARAALARLPESQRVVIHLHRYEELSFEQIAEVLDLPPDAVRNRARAAYQQLQTELRAYIRSHGAR
jgi:RNA polymerase sigma-70 factor (ECF subfamily)